MDASPSNPTLALSELAPGARAVVVRVEATPIGRRLLDLGFVPDTEIRVLRRAPLGDPTTYGLRGMQLCLRRGEARAIRVRVEAPER
ncbi:MAG: FeoA family protein [Myxococcota bacterium]